MVGQSAAPTRGDVVDYTLGSRRIRVLVVSANAYTRNYPVTVLIHSRADGDVPGILLPLPSDLAGAAPSTSPESASPIQAPSGTGTGASHHRSPPKSITAFAAFSACSATLSAGPRGTRPQAAPSPCRSGNFLTGCGSGLVASTRG